ncbi:hypothetical protein F5B20DRAFT_461171 [Whalleya microplaca]|nr:hypothetical protein F5B20DRAFT_461171 [Whalleya microplaca]
MWCQNCGKRRAHSHEMGAANSEYCQRCRSRGRRALTYCRFCGKERGRSNTLCDVHPTTGGYDDEGSNSDSGSPSYSPDNDESYDTDLSDSPVNSPGANSSSTTSEIHCSFCNMTFDYESEKEEHCDSNNSGCSEHTECFPSSENYKHAKEEFHTRCFVPGCDTKFRDDLDWTNQEIVRHVKWAHD